MQKHRKTIGMWVLLGGAFFFALCTAPQTSEAEILYGFAHDSGQRDSALVQLNQADGHIMEFFPWQGVSLSSAATDKRNGALYGWAENAPVEDCGLYRVDVVTGTFTHVGPPQPHSNIRGLAIHPLSREMYAISYPGELYNINKSDGTPTYIGKDRSIAAAHGLSFSSDGVLYCSNTDGELFTIDVDTGEGTLVADIGDNYTLVSIDFDANGRLYAINGGGARRLGIVNISEESWTDLGSFEPYGQIIGIQGMAFHVIPEPATILLLGLGGLALLRKRRL